MTRYSRLPLFDFDVEWLAIVFLVAPSSSIDFDVDLRQYRYKKTYEFTCSWLFFNPPGSCVSNVPVPALAKYLCYHLFCKINGVV